MRNIINILISVSFLSFLNCFDKDDNPAGPNENELVYPIKIGAEWDSDIIFYDYISSKGLVCRSIVFRDMIVTGESGPEPLGLLDSKIESVLTKVN